MEYILAAKEPGCFLCTMIDDDQDRDHLILKRGPLSFTVMNRYPYNNGHCMVAPYRHVASMEELNDDEALDVVHGVRNATRVLKSVVQADGFNVGINLGKAAGAGLEEHLHVHVVPRWTGDTNFMPVMANTKVMPQALFELFDQLQPHFQETA